jgi:hypothetical protein
MSMPEYISSVLLITVIFLLLYYIFKAGTEEKEKRHTAISIEKVMLCEKALYKQSGKWNRCPAS